jgi:hypothetical protein
MIKIWNSSRHSGASQLRGQRSEFRATEAGGIWNMAIRKEDLHGYGCPEF